MSYTNQIDLKPFSDKYVSYYNRCFSSRVNCLEGAYRAGKSVINIFSFAAYLEYCKDKLHLVTGYSSTTARTNVAECSGYGLSYIFRGRCKSGKHEGNECLKIKTKTGEKVVIFIGGGQSDSYKKIQGLSFGSWLSVELANLYISDDDKCFIDMALSRLIQSKCQKIWWDLNPTYPTHKVYKKYLDKYEEMSNTGTFVGNYNFMRCSLFDNSALTEEQRQSYISAYPDVTSVDYKRKILGERACSEGIIFTMFARDPSNWVINDLHQFLISVQPQFLSIGVDFGGKGSNTTFVCTLIYNNYSGVFPIISDLLDMSGGESDSSEFRSRFKEFILRVKSMNELNRIPLRFAFGDCADTVMINEMHNVINELHMASTMRVLDSQKYTIKKRIDTKKMLINRHNWLVYKDAETVINSTETQVWNNKEGHEDERLDDGTCDIDTADAEEYSWSAFIDRLIINSERGA
jgi:hypothetical protein